MSPYPPLLKGYSYPSETIQDYADNERLLSMRMSVVPRVTCNLDCLYCYTADESVQDSGRKPLTFEQRIQAISEAAALGAKSIVCIGDGEPLMYRPFKELVEEVRARVGTFVTFTNMTLVTRKWARFLHDKGVSVIGKCDGPEEIQDLLSGKGHGSYSKMQSGLKNLIDAGYTADNTKDGDRDVLRLGLGVTICSANLRIVPDLWRDMRRRGIFPNFERATIMGSALKTGLQEVTPEQTKTMTNELRRIDEEEFGLKWFAPYGPIPGHQCYLFTAGTHLNMNGGVCPCPELPPLDHYPDKPLEKIIHSTCYQILRHATTWIRACHDCEASDVCYGCRSKAFHCTGGNILGNDPYCPVRH